MKYIIPPLVLILLVFSSCKKQTTYVKQIVNNSNYTFSVTYFNVVTSKQETHEVEPHASTVIYIQTLEGANTEADKCLADMRNLEVVSQENLIFVLDVQDERNWESSVSKNKSNVRQTCVMRVDNVDFVPE